MDAHLLHDRMESASPVLREEDRLFFRRNGYVVVRNLASPRDLLELREIYERMFQNKSGIEDGNYFDLASANVEDGVLPQITDMVRYGPDLQQTAIWRNVGVVARQLLGPTADFVFDHAIRKPPNGPATPYHQDYAYYDIFTRYQSLTFWIPMHDATVDNGCMWFIPGSHLEPLMSHRPLGNDPRIHALEIVDPNIHTRAVAAPIQAGDCTIHHPLTVHGTGPNRSTSPRLAYALAFGTHTRRSLIRKNFSWNAVKSTERKRRQFASLSSFGKLKYVTKVGLIKAGLY